MPPPALAVSVSVPGSTVPGGTVPGGTVPGNADVPGSADVPPVSCQVSTTGVPGANPVPVTCPAWPGKSTGEMVRFRAQFVTCRVAEALSRNDGPPPEGCSVAVTWCGPQSRAAAVMGRRKPPPASVVAVPAAVPSTVICTGWFPWNWVPVTCTACGSLASGTDGGSSVICGHSTSNWADAVAVSSSKSSLRVAVWVPQDGEAVNEMSPPTVNVTGVPSMVRVNPLGGGKPDGVTV